MPQELPSSLHAYNGIGKPVFKALEEGFWQSCALLQKTHCQGLKNHIPSQCVAIINLVAHLVIDAASEATVRLADG